MRLLVSAAESDLRLSLELLFSEQPGVHIVGTASEGDGLQALIRTTKPDIVIADWHLSERPLSTIIFHTIERSNPPQFIVLTNNDTESQIALNSGANFAVVKGAPPDQLLRAFSEASHQTTPRRK
jgi:DNA-binding NarL/FixJ family response regulator